MSLNKYPHNGEPPSSSPHDPDITFTEGISAISIQSPTPYSYIPSLQATPLPSYESVRRPSGNSSSPTASQDLNSDLSFALPGRLENISGDVFQTPSIDKGLPGQIITATQLQQYISSTSFLDSDGPSLAPVQDDSEDYYGTSPLANIANSFARLDQKKDLQTTSVSDDTRNMLQQTLLSPERQIFVKRELKIEASEEFMECADLSQLQSPEPQQSMSNLQATPRVQKRRATPSHVLNENSTMFQVLRNFNFSVPVDSSTVTSSSQQQKAAKSSSLSLLCGNHRLLSFPERETLDYRDATGAVAALVSPSPLAPHAGDVNRSARGGRQAQLTSLGGPSAEQVAGMAEGDAALPYASGKQLLLSDEGSLCKKSYYQPLGQFSQAVLAGEQSPQVGAYGMSVGQYCTAEQASPGNVATSQPGPTSGTQHSSHLLPTQYHPSQALQQQISPLHQISPHQAPLQQISPQQIQHQLSPQQIHHQQNSHQLIVHQQSPQLIHHHQSPQPIHLHQQSPQPINQQSPQPIQHHHQQSPQQVQHQQISPQHLSPQEYFAHQMQQHKQRQQLQQSTQPCMNVSQESAVGSQMKGPRRLQQISILGEDNSIILSTDHSNHHQLTWASQQQQEQKPADIKPMDHYVLKIDCSSSAGKRFKACIKSLDMAEDDGCGLDTFYMNHASQSNGEAAGVSIASEELNFGVQDHGNVEGSVLAAAADGERRADGQSLPRSAGSPQPRTGHEGVSSQTGYALSLNNSDLANRNNNNNNNIVNKIDSYSSTSALANSQTNKPSKAVKRKASSTVRATSHSFLCGVCQMECYTRIALRKHLHDCHKESSETKEVSGLSVCPVVTCRYSTYERSEFDRHFQKHLLLDGLTPTGKPRSSQAPLLRHRYCKEEIKCPLCSYKCVQMSAFARHIEFHKKKIPIEKYCSCPFCGIDFHEDSEMRAHMNHEHKSAEHPDNDHWKCMSCTFTSVQEKKLIQHLRMHTGEKPHLCSHCSYRAGRRDNLRSHVRRMHHVKNLYADSFQPAIAHLLEGLDLNDKDANDENSGHGNEAMSYEDNDQNGDMGADGSRNSSLGDSQPIVGLPSNGQEFEIDSTLANLPYNVLDSFSGSGNGISAVNMDSMMNELMNNSPVVFDSQIMLPGATSYSMWPAGDVPSSSGSRGHTDAPSMVDAAAYGAHATHQVSIQSLATHHINTQPICTQQISSQPVNTQQINIQQINTQHISTQQINTQQINTQQINTQQINTQQINMQQINAQQINAQQINAQQINAQQINAQQITMQQINNQQHS